MEGSFFPLKLTLVFFFIYRHTLQYVQLDPEPSMRQIVEEARVHISDFLL